MSTDFFPPIYSGLVPRPSAGRPPQGISTLYQRVTGGGGVYIGVCDDPVKPLLSGPFLPDPDQVFLVSLPTFIIIDRDAAQVGCLTELCGGVNSSEGNGFIILIHDPPRAMELGDFFSPPGVVLQVHICDRSKVKKTSCPSNHLATLTHSVSGKMILLSES